MISFYFWFFFVVTFWRQASFDCSHENNRKETVKAPGNTQLRVRNQHGTLRPCSSLNFPIYSEHYYLLYTHSLLCIYCHANAFLKYFVCLFTSRSFVVCIINICSLCGTRLNFNSNVLVVLSLLPRAVNKRANRNN